MIHEAVLPIEQFDHLFQLEMNSNSMHTFQTIMTGHSNLIVTTDFRVKARKN